MRPILLVLASISLYSCKKEVKLNLDDAGPHIVIQGEITDASGPYIVKINQSVSFGSENSFPAVSGASIKISDNEGHADSLTESSPGVYATQSLQGKPGNTYTMSVQLLDSLYTATSTMPYPVVLDSITFRKAGAFGNKNIRAVPNFQDPPGIKNYYLFNEYLNGLLVTKDIFVFDDRLSDGRYFSRDLRNSDETLHEGDSLEVQMYCIDEPVFNYFNQLDEAGGRGGAFNTAASPANPVSNISNGALGYFSAHTFRSGKTKVHIE
ncbi:DUF4249 domain-containing protein [Flavitalea sp. BT771]|uniref:DUF4249 domain-containing protein n=1 Tax=Flavitalea sp. BT771 TaxID=3063329 RepID=UPI0026E1D286|nr:DUF4249 domain-containing protein [Flavitalea sp. BT771]MDO6430478.1 DUF4249 domain-containing protein [Flavitalea sp. BT771]MDV6219382.1 DUF4249 domain-containing protein [Flavitalea sp. BT771]